MKNKAVSYKSDISAEESAKIVEALRQLYPDAACSLEYDGDSWKLLVAACLSAQCTDARVNLVTRELFRRFPDAPSAAAAPIDELERLIRPCGLHRAKSASVKNMSAMICNEFGGKVPSTMEELLKLPGVGRKIANLVLGDVYGLGGIVADTHCIRICGRLGYYSSERKDPLFTERVMDTIIPTDEQSSFCHRLVLFGREYCTARSPRCAECPLRELCRAAARDDCAVGN